MSEEAKNELKTLKERATTMGLNFPKNAGLEAMRKLVNDAIEGKEPEPEVEDKTEPTEEVKLTPQQVRAGKMKAARQLVRIRLTCMNPQKSEWDGEVITVSNSVIGTIKRFVPFHAGDEGWHVERAIFNVLRDRQCQVFTNKKTKHGTVRKGKLIKEFSIEVLDPLSEKELKELAKVQAARRGDDE